MKLKAHSPAEYKAAKKVDPAFISINRRNGRVALSKGATSILKAKDKDQLSFLQNEEAPKDWYVANTKEGGFPIWESGAMLAFNNKDFAAALLKSLGIGFDTCKIPISQTPIEEQGMNLHLLIAGAVVNTHRKPKS